MPFDCESLADAGALPSFVDVSSIDVDDDGVDDDDELLLSIEDVVTLLLLLFNSDVGSIGGNVKPGGGVAVLAAVVVPWFAFELVDIALVAADGGVI